jgi:hypothetical protein
MRTANNNCDSGKLQRLEIMSAKIKFGIAALVVAGAVVVAVIEYQSQARLATENESLRQQIAQMQTDEGNLSNQIAASSAHPADDSQVKELMRLRGEVGRLRDQTNRMGIQLAQRDRALAARPVADASATVSDEEKQKEVWKQIAAAKMSDAKLMALAELMYAQNNQNQLGTNYAQLASYLTNGPETLTGTNSFELVYHGSLTAVQNPGSSLMMRESQASQMPDGTWARTYVFIDGHAEFHMEPSGDFTQFEQQRTIPDAPGQ